MNPIEWLFSEAPLALVLCLPLLLGYVIIFAARGRILDMISSSGLVRPNYKGVDIPVAAGLMLTLGATIIIALLSTAGLVPHQEAEVFFLLIQGFGILGLIDDLMGSREKSGLKGHLVALVREGKLTTGAFKAICGGILSLLASIILEGSWYRIIIRALILALAANSVNLLDLRPGRAIKGYLFITIVCIGCVFAFQGFYSQSLVLYTPLSVLVGCTLAYAPFDLKAKSMMGDSGSNPLGAAAGLAIVFTRLGVWWDAGWLLLLCAIHIYAERRSITKTIESNRFLKALDMLGRDA